MKRIVITLVLLAGIIFITGCSQEAIITQTKYVCSDGTTVDNPSLCKEKETKEITTTKMSEVITITGVNEVITITNPEPSEVYITGVNAVVYFSESSNPKKIYLIGVGSIAYLCKGIHIPSVVATGLNAQAIYRSC